MDLCLAILKKKLFTTQTNLKLILMSATMEKEKFQNYFASRSLIKGIVSRDGLSTEIISV
jgi:HrpA-like RNA helicase